MFVCFPALCFLAFCCRMLTQSTTLRTTGSSTCWISAILTAGDIVYTHPNPTPAHYSVQIELFGKTQLTCAKLRLLRYIVQPVLALDSSTLDFKCEMRLQCRLSTLICTCLHLDEGTFWNEKVIGQVNGNSL